MTVSYDLILRGGIIVNHDGVGQGDIAVKAGRIAAIGDLGQADAGEVGGAQQITREGCGWSDR